jgi:hypothetical protein
MVPRREVERVLIRFIERIALARRQQKVLDPVAEEIAGILEAKGLVKLCRQDLKRSGKPRLIVVRE